MANKAKTYSFYLGLGDTACFIGGLLLALILRSGGWPRWELLELHILPFLFIFALWIIVFYTAGLYDLRTLLFKPTMAHALVNAQLVNSGMVILLFYFVPEFIIAPKTVLLIDLIITLVLLFGWRVFFMSRLSSVDREPVFIMGETTTATELKDVLGNPNFGMRVVDDLADARTIILDMNSPKIESIASGLYPRIWSGVRFLDLDTMYEQITGRVPTDLLSDRWVLENISLHPKYVYTVLKRIMDVVIALPLALVSLILWPIVYVLHGGTVFSFQTRVGQNDKMVRIIKLRTMTNPNDGGKWGADNGNKETRLGSFLRRARLDEFPQLWNVVRGDISLIGPRPEFPDAVREYERRIPHYKVRHIIKPGLSGWAQINQTENPHHNVDVDLTRSKLSYDLYYIKNRSFMLDLKIALRTIKTLLMRVGA